LSSDSVTINAAGPAIVVMSRDLSVGLAVTSHDTAVTAAAVLDAS
jgi:hypothetical protein